MPTSNIVIKSSFFWKCPEIEGVVVISSYYFKLIKEENRNRCSHMLTKNKRLLYRSSSSEVHLRKGVLKIFSKFQ